MEEPTKGLPIKYCTSIKPYCNARIKEGKYSLCCRYGWCEYAEPSQDRKHRFNIHLSPDREEIE